jgi:predicted PurR-regulated permease PerM
VVISIILVLLSIAFFFWLVLPEMIKSITHFFSSAKSYVSIIEDKLKSIDAFADEYNVHLGAKSWPSNVYAYLNNKFSNFSQNLQYARDTVVSIWNIALNAFIGVIIAVYFLAGKKRLFAGIDKLRKTMLTEDQYRRHTDFLRRSNAIFSKYISYTILEAIAVGLANAAFMLIAGMPNVVLISVVVGVTNILPTFGPIAGAIIGAFILFLDDPMYALIFIIFTCILQTIDGYVVKPHLFGDSLGIPAVISSYR